MRSLKCEKLNFYFGKVKMKASEALEKLISDQQKIDVLKSQQKKLQNTIAAENKKLSERIKQLEKEQLVLAEKFATTSQEKTFKVTHQGHQVSFSRSIRHTFTQKSLQQILGKYELQKILDNPLIKSESLLVNIRKCQVTGPSK